MEKVSDNKKVDYFSILHKINHKPIIIEYIFSFIKNEPYKFLFLIEKDQQLKEIINSFFSNIKKHNFLSKELNDNIQTIQLFKQFKEILTLSRGSGDFKLENYEKTGINKNIDPSFLFYKTKYLLEKYLPNKNFISVPFSSFLEMTVYDEEKSKKNKILTYLPNLKDKYLDGNYIYKHLSVNNGNENNIDIKEIDTLFCIIDDNEYYNLNLSHLKKDIIINEVYFLYIKGNKNINILDAIDKYLNRLNKNIIKQITLGPGFFIGSDIINMPIFEIIKNADNNKKKLSIQSSTLVKIDYLPSLPKDNIIRLYFGIFKLFQKAKIEGFIVLDYKTYKSNINQFKQLQYLKGKVLIIKIYDTSNLLDKNFAAISEELMNCDIPYIIYYISDEEKYNKDNTKSKIKTNEEIKIKVIKEFLFYSEIPKKINFEFDQETAKEYFYHYHKVTDYDNDCILFQQTYRNICFLNFYFNLLKKYEKFCYEGNYYDLKDNYYYYKLYFMKHKNSYNTYNLFKESNIGIKDDSKNSSINIYSEVKENYFDYDKFDLQINNIQNENFPCDLKHICKEIGGNTGNIKIGHKNKRGQKMSKKCNKKYELEEEMEEYSDDSQEDDYDDSSPE